MTKTKKKQKSNWLRGPAPSDSPIYKTGRILLRPIHGRKPEVPSDESTVGAESGDPTAEDQESPESTD
jgi:hypothetical protein